MYERVNIALTETRSFAQAGGLLANASQRCSSRRLFAENACQIFVLHIARFGLESNDTAKSILRAVNGVDRCADAGWRSGLLRSSGVARQIHSKARAQDLASIAEEDSYQIALVVIAESLRSRLNINEELSDILLDESIWDAPESTLSPRRAPSVAHRLGSSRGPHPA
jgi:hypothetical protein